MNAMQRPPSHAKAPIRIGIVNNMPDAALAATERQFTRLLESAPCQFGIDIRLFYLPEIARGEAARMQLQARYAPIDTLPGAGIDALIVTGCEPVRSSLADEPYYPSLTKLIDWAKDNTISTIWSCLAAHAAVLHLDDVRRQKLPRKLTGVYEFERMSDHPLLRGITGPVRVPHSRLNGLSSDDLVGHSYELLTYSNKAGVDGFVKMYGSLFVFLQGHPEYEHDSLYREYRRDVGRFLFDQKDEYPLVPQNYLTDDAIRDLTALAEEVRPSRKIDDLERFPQPNALRLSSSPWQTFADCLYRNWISYVGERSQTGSRQSKCVEEPRLEL
jgi:homoserine O-succinyltransferase